MNNILIYLDNFFLIIIYGLLGEYLGITFLQNSQFIFRHICFLRVRLNSILSSQIGACAISGIYRPGIPALPPRLTWYPQEVCGKAAFQIARGLGPGLFSFAKPDFCRIFSGRPRSSGQIRKSRKPQAPQRLTPAGASSRGGRGS